MKKFLFAIIIILFNICISEATIDIPEGRTPECLNYIDTLKKNFPNYSYGWVEVPENWFDQKNFGKIKVFYYTNFEPNKKMVPMVYFNGGPNYSSWGTLDWLNKFIKDYNLQIAPVVMDQRGTGCSDALPIVSDQSSMYRAGLYSSDHLIKDAELIRQKMKISKWKVFGQSYGANIMVRYLMDAPESILSAHAYSGSIAETFEGFFYNRLIAQHDMTTTFMNEQPDFYKKLIEARDSLTSEDCAVFDIGKVCGKALFGTFFSNTSGMPSQTISATFKSFFTDSTGAPIDGFNKEAFLKMAKNNVAGYFNPLKKGVRVLYRNEFRHQTAKPNLAIDCQQARAKIEKDYFIKTEGILFNECDGVEAIFENQGILDLSEGMENIPTRQTFDWSVVTANLKKHKGLKVYLYGGGMDGTSSFTAFQKLYSMAPKNISYRLFPSRGHGGYRWEPIIWQTINTK